MAQHDLISPVIWTATGICVLLTGAVVSAALWRPAAAPPCLSELARQANAPMNPETSGLTVRFERERLYIEWNPASPAVRVAQNGILSIRDGALTRSIPLDASKLADGGFWYKPSSIDLLVRLTLNASGKGASESARVLLSETLRPSEPPPPKPLPQDALKAFTAPVAARRVQPAVDPQLRRLLGDVLVVRVRLRIDEGGNVVEADTDALPDRNANALAQAAVRAARQWTFEPARRNGVPVQCGYSISFRFTPLK